MSSQTSNMFIDIGTASFIFHERDRIKDYNEHLEIVSLVGTLSAGAHVHGSFSDSEGRVIGGHVIGDLHVYTTAEIVIGDCQAVSFTRAFDEKSGYPELVVSDRKVELD